MTATRPGQGRVTPVQSHLRPHRPRRPPGPKKPSTIFARSAQPFRKDNGTEVELSEAKGYTAKGNLAVPFRMQLPPIDQWQDTNQSDWATFSVVGGDNGPEQRSRFGGPQLEVVAFRTAFLDWDPSWAVWSPDSPSYGVALDGEVGSLDPVSTAIIEPLLAVQELKSLQRGGVKFRLRIRNSGLYVHDDVNMLATLTQCNVTETAGEPDTRYLDLSFQEYRPNEVERLSAKNELGPWTHKIVTGDTLYRVARKYYGRHAEWAVISLANAGLEHQPPSGDLLAWARRHHRTSIKVPPKPTRPLKIVGMNAKTGAITLPGGRVIG